MTLAKGKSDKDMDNHNSTGWIQGWGMGCSLVEETREPAICFQAGVVKGPTKEGGRGGEFSFGACGWLLLGVAKEIMSGR